MARATGTMPSPKRATVRAVKKKRKLRFQRASGSLTEATGAAGTSGTVGVAAVGGAVIARGMTWSVGCLSVTVSDAYQGQVWTTRPVSPDTPTVPVPAPRTAPACGTWPGRSRCPYATVYRRTFRTRATV